MVRPTPWTYTLEDGVVDADGDSVIDPVDHLAHEGQWVPDEDMRLIVERVNRGARLEQAIRDRLDELGRMVGEPLNGITTGIALIEVASLERILEKGSEA